MAYTLLFEAGSTTHVETFTVNGTSGSDLVTINSSDGATPHYLVNDTIIGIVCEYLDLSHSHASPINYWNANNSLDTVDNTGWFEGTDTPVTGIKEYAGRSRLFRLTYSGYNMKKHGYSSNF